MLRIVVLACVLCALMVKTGVTQAQDLAYQLRAGDQLQVSVWREETLQKEVRVLPDGSISFPLAGRVVVRGLTTPEVEKLIATRLEKFIPEPNVTVLVSGIESNRVFVLGKVARSAPIPMVGTLTVLQALSMGGGLDRFADETGIKVIRSSGNGSTAMAVNYADIVSGRNMSTNYVLERGDVVFVP